MMATVTTKHHESGWRHTRQRRYMTSAVLPKMSLRAWRWLSAYARRIQDIEAAVLEIIDGCHPGDPKLTLSEREDFDGSSTARER